MQTNGKTNAGTIAFHNGALENVSDLLARASQTVQRQEDSTAAPHPRPQGQSPAGDPQPAEAPRLPELANLEVVEDRQAGILWQYMTPTGRPSFTLPLLRDLWAPPHYLESLAAHEGANPFEFLVTGSRTPGIYILGGDLPHFVELIRARDRAGLRHYAQACAEGQHARHTNFDLPICTISLVQGDALGGGFECALADDVIIAERGAKFGLPEVLFGLFPGMGAYSFLSRRVSAGYAEKLILSGEIYTAEEMHDAGIVDVLVEDGEGERGVYDFVKRERKRMRTRRALRQIRRRVNPVTRDELIGIAELWADIALELSDTDLKKMTRLAQAQDKRLTGTPAAPRRTG